MHAATADLVADALPTLPENAGFLLRMRLAAKSLQELAKDPGHTHYGPLINACMDSETYKEVATRWRAHAEAGELLVTRPTLQGPDLDLAALRALPAGSLGRAFADYFAANKIEPFVTSFPINNDVDYLSKRYRETHDLFHILTGYGTDEDGEMELQAFVMGNLGLKQTRMILAFGVSRRLRQPGFGAYLNRLRAAYRRGQRSRELLSVRFERLFDRPLDEVASLLVAPV